MLSLSFLGAAGTVTGSKHLLTHGDTQLLVDCGLFQGLKHLRALNWVAPRLDVRSLDAVVLTHAHLDHTGYLPRLMREGYRGPVYATAATHDVAALILRDSAHLQEKDAADANRYGYSRHQPAQPLYGLREAELAIAAIRARPLHEPTPLPGGAQLTLRRAGHILGAATAQIEIGGCRVLFSGDLGRDDDPVMLPPETVPEADYVVLESTYGDRVHDTSADPLAALGEVVTRTVRRGGTVVIPAFAVGRAQTLIYLLWQLRESGVLRNVPVYLDSPMAGNATALLQAHASEHRLAPEVVAAACSAVTYVRDAAESQALSANAYPKVIISASGMASGGRVLHHLAAFAPHHRNTVLFSGYQAAGTRGRRLLDGATEVKIHGQWVPVRAEVTELPMLSAHADSDGLLRWLRGLRRAPRHVFLVHGEASAADTLRVRIERELGWSASVPRQDEVVRL